MAKVKIVLNSQTMSSILNSSAVRAELRAEARPMLAEAQRRAPVDTGAYKASLQIVDATTDRAVVRVVATDRKAMLIESRMGVLSRAARGKALFRRREKARERARDRAHDRKVARQENEAEW